MHRTVGYAIHISFCSLNTRHEIDVQLHFCVIDSSLIRNIMELQMRNEHTRSIFYSYMDDNVSPPFEKK